jgi:hypothetical protein
MATKGESLADVCLPDGSSVEAKSLSSDRNFWDECEIPPGTCEMHGMYCQCCDSPHRLMIRPALTWQGLSEPN